MVTLEYNGQPQEFKQWKFPGGEVGVKLLQDIDILGSYKVSILGIPSSDDIFIALNLCDALGSANELYLPYVPYARQDRRCHTGESNALGVFIQVLVSCGGYQKLTIVDPHSEQTIQWIKTLKPSLNLNIIEQHECTKNLPQFDCIIAPDKGALEKAKLTQPNVEHIYLNKTRTETGIVYEDYPQDKIKGNVCVVDDFVDGGQTFLELARMLEKTQPNIQSLNLYVTYGIFSKGCFALGMHYNNIYCYNLMNSDVDHLVQVIK